MIQRERYLSRIRPFIGNDLVKVLTGIRRSGKSVMLELIKEELQKTGVSSSQFISLNFENMSNAHLCTARALHEEILRRAAEIPGKVCLFFDEIQEVASWAPIWPAGMWSLSSIPSPSGSLSRYTAPFFPRPTPASALTGI